MLWEKSTPKGKTKEIKRQRTQHAVKSHGAIAGGPLANMRVKRNQKLEVRKAQWEQAFRSAQEAKQAETTQ